MEKKKIAIALLVFCLLSSSLLVLRPIDSAIAQGDYLSTETTKAFQGIDIASGGIVYAGAGNTIYKSLDNGQTWTALKTIPNTDEIEEVFCASNGYVYAVPEGRNIATSDRGIWRSVDNGSTWSRVLALDSASESTVQWAFDEDGSGRLFAGVYTYSGTVGNARIYRSVNNGTTWSSVYYDSAGRHVHDLKVDRRTGYIYATVGDFQISPWTTEYILRSVDNGTSWQKILSGLTQCVAICITPTARIFGSDDQNAIIYKTTDDSAYTSVSLGPSGSYCVTWIKMDSVSGQIFTSIIGQDSIHPSTIYKSVDGGSTWTLYRTFDTIGNWYGSQYSSKFVSGVLYYSINYAAYQNGIRMEYTTSPVQYSLTMYTVGQGSVSPGNGTYLSGTSVDIQASNVAGWTFQGWSGDASGSSNTTITMSSNKVVTATFAQNATSGGGTFGYTSIGASTDYEPANYMMGCKFSTTEAGAVTKISAYIKALSGTANVRAAIYSDNSGVPGTLLAQSGVVSVGSTASWVNFTLSYNVSALTSYWLVLQWSAGVTIYFSSGATSQFAYTPQSYASGFPSSWTRASYTNWKQNIYATYSSLTPQYSLTMYTVGQGSVVPGNGTYAAGTNITIKAINALGWNFTGWSGGASGSSNTSIIMNGNTVVTASFTQNQYPLVMYTTGQGSVTPGNQTFASGTVVNIKAINAAGWAFAGWSGGASGSANTTVTMNSPLTVTATFTQENFTISLQSPNNGTTTIDNMPDFKFTGTHPSQQTFSCSLWLQNATYANLFATKNNVANGSLTTLTPSTPIPNGDWQWWINCSYGSTSNISDKRNITINAFRGDQNVYVKL